MLSGKKTYLSIAVVLGAVVAKHMGVITPDQAQSIETVFGAGALAFLRNAIPVGK